MDHPSRGRTASTRMVEPVQVATMVPPSLLKVCVRGVGCSGAGGGGAGLTEGAGFERDGLAVGRGRGDAVGVCRGVGELDGVPDQETWGRPA